MRRLLPSVSAEDRPQRGLNRGHAAGSRDDIRADGGRRARRPRALISRASSSLSKPYLERSARVRVTK
ncbi:hypothetical protein EVAR_55110_1 [Eumeta japonica]|uniref:Uncharacterized protein n=1 Tax=Eumeta variegata TaxID=151549 RepID=A0A4C1YIE9_EUMVA|nr:hypothetical protein EVAR_55110_1 [Eumeta japonica]